SPEMWETGSPGRPPEERQPRRQDQNDLGAIAFAAVDGEAAADPLGALTHADHTEVAGLLAARQDGVWNAHAVIAHAHGQVRGLEPARDAGPWRVRVAGNVGQRFAHYPDDLGRDQRVERPGISFHHDAHRDRRIDRGRGHELADQGAQVPAAVVDAQVLDLVARVDHDLVRDG